MGTPTYYYVRPVTGANVAGQGTTDGTAYLTVQFALDDIGLTHGRDAVNGDQVNVNDEGDDVLAATISLVNYGAPSATVPLIFRGYTVTANDGGVGGVSGGGGNFSIFNNLLVKCVNMHLHNTGTARVVWGADASEFVSCEIDNSSTEGLRIGRYGQVVRCHIHNTGGISLAPDGATIGQKFLHNFIEYGPTYLFTTGIRVPVWGVVIENTVKLAGSAHGITSSGADFASVVNNTVFATAGTGNGIFVSSGSGGVSVFNNYAEGFSGVGGDGFLLFPAANDEGSIVGHNYAYNNTTNFTIGDATINLGNNTVLGASALANPAANNFSVSTALRAAGWPSDFLGSNTDQFLDVGAAQREEPSGGGGRRRRIWWLGA